MYQYTTVTTTELYMNDIIIRSANLNDMSTLLEFEQGIISAERAFDTYLKADPISYYDLEQLILSESAEVVVAEINHKIVGSGYAKIKESKAYMEHDFHAYLGFMYVESAQRGKGINELILNFLKQWSKAQNVYHLTLDVYADNQAAIRAYEKAGFSKNLIEMKVCLGEIST